MVTKTKVMKAILLLGALALIAAILIPNFIGCRCGSPLTACKSNLKNIGTALEMYSTDYDGRYPINLSRLTPNYLKTIPECPRAGRVTYRGDFGPRATGNDAGVEDFYLVECTGTTHRDYDLSADYPKYDSIRGLVEGPRER